jgi:MFS superfamily sulfate permease-like transporter
MLAAHSLLPRRGTLRGPNALPRRAAPGQPLAGLAAAQIVSFRLTCPLSASFADALVNAVSSRVRTVSPPPCAVVLDLSRTRGVDNDVQGALQRLRELLAQSEACLRLVHPQAEVRATLTTAGPAGAISPQAVHVSLREALLAAYASLPGPALVTSATRAHLAQQPELLSLR